MWNKLTLAVASYDKFIAEQQYLHIEINVKCQNSELLIRGMHFGSEGKWAGPLSVLCEPSHLRNMGFANILIGLLRKVIP